MGQPKRRALKQALFERDGWFDDERQEWLAHCAFGCGDVLDFRHATMDRYPVPGRDGGGYWVGNTRLACAPCNSSEASKGDQQRPKTAPMTQSIEESKAAHDKVLEKEFRRNYRNRGRQNMDVEGSSNAHGVRMDLK